MGQTLDPRTVAAGATTLCLDEPWQVAHWLQEFGVAEQELRQAMQAVGDKVDDVRRQLERAAAARNWPAGMPMDDQQLTVAGFLIPAGAPERRHPYAS
jgi:Protein of unknown function (DUF3606)